MDFEFSIEWMLIGLLITLAGGLIVVFYRQIAHGMANGVASYGRIKLFGIITVVIGLIITANLHTLVLSFLVNIIFGK